MPNCKCGNTGDSLTVACLIPPQSGRLRGEGFTALPTDMQHPTRGESFSHIAQHLYVSPYLAGMEFQSGLSPVH